MCVFGQDSGASALDEITVATMLLDPMKPFKKSNTSERTTSTTSNRGI